MQKIITFTHATLDGYIENPHEWSFRYAEEEQIWGTGQLTDALAAAGLLDEYRICTSPVIKGGGEPLFRPGSTGTVELLDTKVFATGAVVHAYRPTAAP